MLKYSRIAVSELFSNVYKKDVKQVGNNLKANEKFSRDNQIIPHGASKFISSKWLWNKNELYWPKWLSPYFFQFLMKIKYVFNL